MNLLFDENLSRINFHYNQALNLINNLKIILNNYTKDTNLSPIGNSINLIKEENKGPFIQSISTETYLSI